MKTPMHLWVTGGASLLWNLMGAVDFTMTNTRNEAWLKNFTPEQLTFFTSFPTWSILFWGLGTLGAVAGSLLLLLRSRHAVTAFILSLVGVAGTSLYTYVLAPASMADFAGPGAMAFTAVIVVVAILLLIYALRMRANGVIR